MVDDRSDAQIIAASLADPVEFAALFDRHFDVVHRYVARRLGADLAEDLAAQAFEEALKSRARFDLSHSSARPWLLGIATNLIRHHHRAEARRLAAYGRIDGDGTAADHAAAVELRVDAQRLAAVLTSALAELPGGDRDALLLLAWGDLSYGEIALALHIPIGTVRSRLNRARGRLRERLAASGQYLLEPQSHPELVKTDG